MSSATSSATACTLAPRARSSACCTDSSSSTPALRAQRDAGQSDPLGELLGGVGAEREGEPGQPRSHVRLTHHGAQLAAGAVLLGPAVGELALGLGLLGEGDRQRGRDLLVTRDGGVERGPRRGARRLGLRECRLRPLDGDRGVDDVLRGALEVLPQLRDLVVDGVLAVVERVPRARRPDPGGRGVLVDDGPRHHRDHERRRSGRELPLHNRHSKLRTSDSS